MFRKSIFKGESDMTSTKKNLPVDVRNRGGLAVIARLTVYLLLALSLTVVLVSCVSEEGDVLELGKLLIEHNSTDEDTGFQGFADGEPWNELTITGPANNQILKADTAGGLYDFGLTEFFFETAEPENAVVPIENVLARLAAGTYTFSGEIIDAGPSFVRTSLSHSIPQGPVLNSPLDGATGVDPANVVVSWAPVTQDINGWPVTIVGYQVIVEEDAELLFPEGFARPVLSVHVPATVTSVTLPSEFMRNDACYTYEVLAIEISGNQTIASAAFETGAGCTPGEDPGPTPPELEQAKLLIEHNSTDRDTGFQGFADGDPWNLLTIAESGNSSILTVDAAGDLLNFGLTELFFETSEPENAETPISQVLTRLPEGTYNFKGDMVGGGTSTVSATFTHKIPSGPVLTNPADGATNVDPNAVVVSWDAVTQDINGQAVNIVGYQVIVELNVAPAFPQGFAQPAFSVYLPSTVTSVTVPKEFMASNSPYEYEVLAIEESGNQTLSAAIFSTN
jgi:hypothetical protein